MCQPTFTPAHAYAPRLAASRSVVEVESKPRLVLHAVESAVEVRVPQCLPHDTRRTVQGVGLMMMKRKQTGLAVIVFVVVKACKFNM